MPDFPNDPPCLPFDLEQLGKIPGRVERLVLVAGNRQDNPDQTVLWIFADAQRAVSGSIARGSLTAVVIEALARMRRQWPSAQLQLFLDDHPPPGASASAIDPLALIVPCPPPPPTQQLIQAFDNVEQQIRALPRPGR